METFSIAIKVKLMAPPIEAATGGTTRMEKRGPKSSRRKGKLGLPARSRREGCDAEHLELAAQRWRRDGDVVGAERDGRHHADRHLRRIRPGEPGVHWMRLKWLAEAPASPRRNCGAAPAPLTSRTSRRVFAPRPWEITSANSTISSRPPNLPKGLLRPKQAAISPR